MGSITFDPISAQALADATGSGVFGTDGNTYSPGGGTSTAVVADPNVAGAVFGGETVAPAAGSGAHESPDEELRKLGRGNPAFFDGQQSMLDLQGQWGSSDDDYAGFGQDFAPEGVSAPQTQAEYDALPSGSYYTRTDGAVAVKG